MLAGGVLWRASWPSPCMDSLSGIACAPKLYRPRRPERSPFYAVRSEYFVAFSCKQRGFCPSCSAKRAVLWAEFVRAEVIRSVPHRHLVFALPKALRSAFRHRRQLLPRLARCAWKAVAAFVRDVTGETALPASIVAMQTAGDFLNWHPHLHVLASAGAFLPDGRFIPVPVFDVSVLRELFQAQVLALLVKERMVSTELIDRMKTWRHSGFHAFAGDEIPDTDARRRLHHEGVRRPQDPRPRRAEVRPAQAPRHADVVPVRRRRRCSLPRPAPFRRIRARPLSGLRTAVTRPENGLFRETPACMTPSVRVEYEVSAIFESSILTARKGGNRFHRAECPWIRLVSRELGGK